MQVTLFTLGPSPVFVWTCTLASILVPLGSIHAARVLADLTPDTCVRLLDRAVAATLL